MTPRRSPANVILLDGPAARDRIVAGRTRVDAARTVIAVTPLCKPVRRAPLVVAAAAALNISFTHTHTTQNSKLAEIAGLENRSKGQSDPELSYVSAAAVMAYRVLQCLDAHR